MQAIGDKEPKLQQMWRVFNTVLDEAYAAIERYYPSMAELFEITYKEVEFWDKEDRPKYQMMIGQRKAFELFSRAIHETITGADLVGRWTKDRVRRSCLDMVIQFLDHRFRNRDHYRSIIISALAIIGLADGGGDIDIADIFGRHQGGLVSQLQQVISKEEANEKAEGLFRIMRRKVRGFITQTSGEEDAEPTPMN
ncbi:hypothetical protein DER46DRAFT_578575 [Fusarium sp. MPI-SDFR-AT-0072]|nr:hypothetical protein DER46DRAFT_578575 [Fusarium sp. MPI-SDFR-AT-0072]